MQPTMTAQRALDALLMVQWRHGTPTERMSRHEATADVFDYIERIDNPRRRHSTLGEISPERFERAYEGLG